MATTKISFMDYWQVMERFSRAMYEKYVKRVNKPGNTHEPWKDFPTDLLIKRLYEEVGELEEALRSSDHESAAEELLDVANFCMFLWAKLNLY